MTSLWYKVKLNKTSKWKLNVAPKLMVLPPIRESLQEQIVRLTFRQVYDKVHLHQIHLI